MQKTLLLALTLGLICSLAPDSRAEPTHLVVRVLAHDAKLIGDAAGGARVEVRDAETGELLAHGLHLGGTGSTDLIIREAQVRGRSIYDTAGAAAFECELDLDQPTWVRIDATGPLAYPQSRGRASKTLLMVPGHDIDGDGVVLELEGLIVNLLEPHPERRLHPGDTLEVEAGVKLLCTCPIFDGSLWDAKDYQVQAELWTGGRRIESVSLEIGEEPNVFTGELEIPEDFEGKSLVTELRIVAGNAAQHNYGVDRAVFKIVK